MASSSEAFGKLAMWKKSCSLLNVVIGLADQPQRLVGTIIGTDEPLIMLSVAPSRESLTMDLADAIFVVGERSLEINRDGEEPVIFEEALIF